MNRTPAGPRRVAICLLLAVVALVPALAGSGGVVSAAPGPGADEGLDWIGAQLTANGGSLPASFGPGSDWGITADAVLAHVAAGRGADAPAQSATDELIANVDLFSTWDDLGPEYAGVRLAGQLGKVVLAALAQGRDVTSVGGVDLVAELRSLVQTSGPETGRFSDRNPYSPDNSNGFGQALSMLALSYTDAGVPATSVTFLLDQQCPGGGFRLFYTSTSGCDDASNADTDATALAIQALLAAPRTAGSTAAMADAISWLVSMQDPTSGAWTGSGPTATPNANSTGVIAQTLRASGEIAAADRGAAWIRDQLQLTSAGTVGTPAAADVGAIAYDPAARTLALSEGITTSSGDQWRRATTQAVLALGLERYGAANDDPMPTTSSTTPTSTTASTTPTTAPTTTAPTTTAPTTTAPTTTAPTTTAPTTTAPATTAPGTVVLTGAPLRADALAGNTTRSNGATTRAGSSTSPGRLAVTGTGASLLVSAGVVALLCGLVLLRAGSIRRGRA